MPFVWLEIGPEGYRIYGPTVPHVYIYGGAITGKDLNWMPIAVAMFLQLVCILAFALLAFLTRSPQFKPLPVLLLQTFLLILFPFWINLYVDGVIGNSDGADMTVHWQIGMYIYGLLAVLNVVGVVKAIQAEIEND